MKILFISAGDNIDYQADCLFVGLREMFGAEVVDANKHHHAYLSHPEAACRQMYGMGMSVTRLLDDIEVDRTDIEAKIRTRYFDLIVFGSIFRNVDFLELVIGNYPADKIIAVDGEDHGRINTLALDFGMLYFKRELSLLQESILPINFAMPTSRFKPNLFNKTRDFSICDPRDRSTYIYKDEASYYGGYREARLAVTTKKSGWDCMRHYEIIANGALPVFLDVEACPAATMVSYEKARCKKIIEDLALKMSPADIYEKHAWAMFSHALVHNTTSALGEYLVNSWFKARAHR